MRSTDFGYITAPTYSKGGKVAHALRRIGEVSSETRRYLDEAKAKMDAEQARRAKENRARAGVTDPPEGYYRHGYAKGGLTEKYLTAQGAFGRTGPKARKAALALRGLASQLLTLDPDGSVGLGTRPGVVSELLALPAFFGADVGWSQEAKKDTEAMQARLDELMQLGAAEGLEENLFESAGQMAGQFPVPAGGVLRPIKEAATRLPKVVRGAATVPAALVEFLGPIVEPRAANYALGTGAGGVLGAAFSEEEEASPEALAQLKSKYAGGGRVRSAARAIRALKNAMSHLQNNDRASAIRELSQPDTVREPDVARILAMLRGPENRLAGTEMQQMIEADANFEVPMLSKGGKISDVVERMRQIREHLRDNPETPDRDRVLDEYNSLHHRLQQQTGQPVRKSKGGKIEKVVGVIPLRVYDRLRKAAKDGAPVRGNDILERGALEVMVEDGEMVRLDDGTFRQTRDKFTPGK